MENSIESGTLYIVATPIGNLEDISLRALKILQGVSVIACEDTRHSLKLLNHHSIKNRLIAYHSYNEKNSSHGIVEMLKSGQSAALISDGGTPCISDPGYLLVKHCRDNSIPVIPIPGASAFVSLLSVSSFRTDRFAFFGFLSPKGGRRLNELKKSSEFEGTLIFYESPHRIIKLVEDIKTVFDQTDICIGKEITKINETVFIGNAEQALNYFKDDYSDSKKINGEFTVLIANYKKK